MAVAAHACIAPKWIFADEAIVECILCKYADSFPSFCQQAMLRRDVGIDVALSTINHAVLRVVELPFFHRWRNDARFPDWRLRPGR